MEGRAADHIIADQNVGENLAPLDAENPSGNLSDRRIRMVGLSHGQLSEEAVMISIPKVVGLMSCGFLLRLGLSNTAQSGQPASSADPAVRKGGQAGVRGEQAMLKSGPRIEGDVLRVEVEHYFVMGQDGEGVRLQTRIPRNDIANHS